MMKRTSAIWKYRHGDVMDKSCMLWFHVVGNASCCILRSILVGPGGAYIEMYRYIMINLSTFNTDTCVICYDDILSIWFLLLWIDHLFAWMIQSSLSVQKEGVKRDASEFIWFLLSIRCTMKLAAGAREIKWNSNWRKNPSWLVCIRESWTKVLNSCIHLGHWHSSLHLISQMGT